MIRGTTPTHIFKTNADLSEGVSELYITYEQGTTVVEKTLSDCTIDTEDGVSSITVTLTQNETLSFADSGYVADVQIRVKFNDGTALASNILRVPISKILKDGVI